MVTVGHPKEAGVVRATSVEIGERAATAAEPRMLIDGELLRAASGAEFDNISPATGRVLGATAAADAADMDRAIDAARRAFDDTGWSTDRELRKRCLQQLQSALEAEKEELRTELIAEVGCPVMTTQLAQLDWPLADALRYPARLIDEFEWERPLDGGGLFGERNMRTVIKEPAGVVAAITPSNFPVEVILNKLGPALAAGNTVVLKPDPHTPWNATRLGRLVAEHTDIPAGVLNVVPTGSNEVAGLLGTDPRVDMISFTGSTDVGKLLARQSADTMKRTFLELGGKSALIVLDDADPAKVIPGAIGVCVHAGQACAATTRMLVHASLFDEVVTAVTAAFAAVTVGEPALPQTLVGPLISAQQKQRVLDAIAQARRDGAEITTGGGEYTDLPQDLAGGYYVQPTVIVGVDNSAAIARQEVFGPVLIILPFGDDDEAVRIANDSPYGLAGAVVSASSERAMAVARRVRTGAIGVNGGMYYGADAPFGGYKSSGWGRQCGIEGFSQYLETKTIGYRKPRGV
ncbi:aldehyde dehydrogenase family protein [Mycolicibacter senuensis]|uniref:Aldehyde dehydrogenase n=1 Tax=Mycolicibacter senuensis TaxID=386913 RepID=A0A7I9XRI8_9MYCO|nr:aldehyde dehydrogenase family protein [Mycolicibacter senuensis]MDQ2627273.1 aldehyde dehydrogenase family protein [Actinomycetota bacterium]ORW64965.1 aldehyde dehydrogenase [Mycolicibacter senuensis]GFG72554.1 aldehyde dehydrogenase [Mycolicibacter senuensis]